MAKNPDDAASAEHRRKLEAMFSGGPRKPDGPPEERSPAPRNDGAPRGPMQERSFAPQRRSFGRTPSEYRMRLERLRMARNTDELRDAADAFLQHHQLPDDPDILTKVMQHPSEKVAREAMGQISALLMQGRMPPTVLLEERLRDLEGRCSEDATRSYISGIQAQLAKLRAP